MKTFEITFSMSEKDFASLEQTIADDRECEFGDDDCFTVEYALAYILAQFESNTQYAGMRIKKTNIKEINKKKDIK